MRSLTKRIALVAALSALVTIVTIATVNHRMTRPHERRDGEVLTIGPDGQLEISLDGCFLSRQDWPILYLRATSLEPKVTLSHHGTAGTTLRLIMQNVSPDLLVIEGAELLESIPEKKQMIAELPLDFEGPKTLDWRLVRTNGEFSFFVVGDNSGTFDILEKIREDILRERPLFVVALGDLTREGTLEEMLRYDEYAASVPVPYFTVLGNHDLEDEKTAAAYQQVFGPTYYSFSYGSAFFVALDNAAGYISLTQMKWLKNQLNAARDSYPKFVFVHQPPHDPRRGRHHAMKPLISGAPLMMSLLAKGGVDYLLCGHIHTYCEFLSFGIKCIITGNTTGLGGTDVTPFPHYVVFKVSGNSVNRSLRLIETEIMETVEASP